ncbi:MAG: hypothetical protein WB696_29555 [Chthoniobacterales bacterium]
MSGHQRTTQTVVIYANEPGYEETFWSEAAAKAGGKRLMQVFAADPIEVFAFVSGFSPSLDEGWRVV